MSTLKKVAAVAEMAPAFGLPAALETFELARSTFYYHQRHACDYEERHLDLKKTHCQQHC